MVVPALAVIEPAEPAAESDNWPHFRGPTMNAAVADNPDLPETWSQTEHVEWVTDVPGLGWSSPVVWGNRVFLTTGHSHRRVRTAETGALRAAGASRAAAARARLAGLLPRPRDGRRPLAPVGEFGPAVVRAPHEEHLRVGNADHRRRAASTCASASSASTRSTWTGTRSGASRSPTGRRGPTGGRRRRRCCTTTS